VAAGKITYANENPAAYANNANADNQLPSPERAPDLIREITHNVIAPDTNRSEVKLAASMSVSFSARRHSSELPAKANMASDVKVMSRAVDMERLSCL
jgi:hypothetical protein